MIVHLAAFEHHDGGRCVEEFLVEAPVPRWLARLPRWAITAWANRQALRLARTAPRAAYVRHLSPNGRDLFVVGMNRWAHKGLGAFAWWRLRVPDYKVDWPETHTFIQIDRTTMRLDGWFQAQEPIAAPPEKLVIDVTGTSWEAGWRTKVFGLFVLHGDRVQFLPDAIGSLPTATPRQLTEAAIDFDVTHLEHLTDDQCWSRLQPQRPEQRHPRPGERRAAA